MIPDAACARLRWLLAAQPHPLRVAAPGYGDLSDAEDCERRLAQIPVGSRGWQAWPETARVVLAASTSRQVPAGRALARVVGVSV